MKKTEVGVGLPRKMIGDLFTFSRAALGGVILGIALWCINEASVNPSFRAGNHKLAVLFMFILGFLTDAVDGPFARKWPYQTEDIARLPRFWQRLRQNPQLFDALVDGILLYSALAFALFCGLDLTFADSMAIFVATVLLGAYGTWQVQSGRPKLLYRWVYIIEVAAVLLALTFSALPVREARVLTNCYGLVAALLLLFKPNRYADDPKMSQIKNAPSK